MGKKSKTDTSSNLGRSLIKDRFGNNKGKKMVANNSMLHTTELQDGYDWGRLNLQSVTEESSFQEFLSTAELAGTDFQAEKLNIKFVNPRSNVGLLTKDEMKAAKETHKKHETNLRIPRRPPWNANTTPDELDRTEKESFLEWRRSLAQLQEEEGILLTPYEKNLEFWRQLWRVVEKSDVIVQIVDARNPTLFRCEDLEKYVKEVSEDKINLILVNKADFLSEEQRQHWSQYFVARGVRIVFYSAYLASIKEEDEETREDKDGKNSEEDNSDDESVLSVTEEEKNSVEDSNPVTPVEANPVLEDIQKKVSHLENAVEENAKALNKIVGTIDNIFGKMDLKVFDPIFNTGKLLNREEFIDFLKKVHTGTKVTPGVTTIGLVGYPNVGKSSTINSLLCSKKVSVSATPGKTKHFQTHYLDNNILLCDCPGLVMPSFVFSKAEMILNGILPIDQMRDHIPPTNLLTSQIPRHVIEDRYGIMIPKPIEGEDPDRDPTAEEILNAYAYNRGFMTANGQPDNARAARYILKDYMNGKLLYCHAPPNVDQKEYQTWPERQKTKLENRVLPPRAVRAAKPYHATTEDVDKVFFMSNTHGAHAKGIKGVPSGFTHFEGPTPDANSMIEKPWKQHNKHKNKAKKEKLRKVYAHLDQH